MRAPQMPFGQFAIVQPQVLLERGSEYPFIAMEDVEPRRREVSPGSERVWDGGGGARFENGDVLFARITPCLEHGKTAQVMNLPSEAGFGSTEFFVFRGRKHISDSRYIYYLSCSHVLREPAIKSMVGAAGRQRAQRTVVEETAVLAPSVQEQLRIASILSAYDDLIENNRRRMKLLEESARQLYREWFVRLRFPGHERVKVTHGLPEGWERKPLVDIAPDLRDAANPADLEPGTPYIGLEHMPRRSITLLEWGTAEQVTSAKLRYKAGDILFGKIRPYFHKVGFALTDGVSSSDSIILRPVAEELHAFVLLTVSSDWFVAVVSKTAKEGSKMPRADWNLMERHELAVPPASILNAFRDVVDPIVSQLKTLAFQNQKLRAARDLLLPKLMSGEIAV